MNEKPDYEAMYQCLNAKYIELEKDNADLHLIEKTQDDYQDKLHDEIDNLRQIITLLVKVNL